MKKFLYSAILLITFVSCKYLRNETDLEKLGIDSKVAVLVDSIFYAKESFGEPEKDELCKIMINEYDKGGNLITSSLINEYENLDYKQKFKRSEDNRIIEINDYDRYGDLFGRTKISYDENTYTKKITRHDPDGNSTFDSQFCDKNWRVIGYNYSKKEFPSQRFYNELEYDKKGRLIKQTNHEGTSKVIQIHEVNYGDNNEYKVERIYNGQNNLIQLDSVVYTRNNDGTVKQWIKYIDGDIYQIGISKITYHN